jgi:aspartate-semialdehyde dehydrogenase
MINPPTNRLPVAVLGATGSVGQRFVQLLDDHPWFDVVALTGSDRKVGKNYAQGCHWVLNESMPEWAKILEISPSDPKIINTPLVFSALPAGAAKEIEPLFAQAGVGVCTNAGAFRQQPDVPILLPEINPDHAQLITSQRRKRGWKGFIVTNPNCTSTGISVVLKALDDIFGVHQVSLVSLQALSGAGYPGVSSLDILDNVIPYISGEETKVEWEPRKILGQVKAGELQIASFTISAQVNRVAVSDGHLVCLNISLKNPPGENIIAERVGEILKNYQLPEVCLFLPSAPKPVIMLRPEDDRPQPRLDRMSGKGMSTVVGRIRPDPIFDLKLVVLSHNTIRGAAGGSIFNAELLLSQGYLEV